MKTFHRYYERLVSRDPYVTEKIDETFVAMKTMTVAELVAELQKWPGDMPVLTTWKGQIVPIAGPKYIEPQSQFHMGVESEACDVLVIDVDNFDRSGDE